MKTNKVFQQSCIEKEKQDVVPVVKLIKRWKKSPPMYENPSWNLLTSLQKKYPQKEITTDVLKSYEIEELLHLEISKRRKFRKSSRNSMTPRMPKFIFGWRAVILISKIWRQCQNFQFLHIFPGLECLIIYIYIYIFYFSFLTV